MAIFAIQPKAPQKEKLPHGMDALPAETSNPKPSLFELLSSDSLSRLISPTSRYLISILCTRFPRQLLTVANWHDELFLLFMGMLQWQYLRRRSASLTEDLHGIRRVSSSSNEAGLSKLQKVFTLFFLVGWPYLADRLEALHQSAGGGVDPDLFLDERAPSAPTGQSRYGETAAKLMKRFYPALSMAHQSVLTVYNISYLAGYTRYFRPWEHAMGIELVRSDGSAPVAAPNSVAGKTWEKIQSITPMLLLIMSSFQTIRDRLPPPPRTAELPVPALLPPHSDGLLLPEKLGVCPITLQQFSNPCLLVKTGYVYEFNAIHDWIEEKRCCPVTLIPAAKQDLRKIHWVHDTNAD